LIIGKKNFSLKSFNTFGVDSTARIFYEVSTLDHLGELLEKFSEPYPFIIGGGSNVLLPSFLDRVVVSLRFSDWEVIEDDPSFAVVRIGAGWDWHKFVLQALDEGFGGVENLSLIPGTVGAAPIQNIGAYGVEIKDLIHSVEFFSFEDKKVQQFKTHECKFGYRSSIFKHQLNGKGAVTRVSFRLPKQGYYDVNTSYASLAELALKNGSPSAHQISQWVIDIRQSKLPDPNKLGNAGSFFKNPIIKKERWVQLRKQFSDMPSYPVSEEQVKVPAAWLIDRGGWKGKRKGQVGSYEKQPLVIVNFDGASQSELIDWAKSIQQDVHKRFGIFLEPEVNILDTRGERMKI